MRAFPFVLVCAALPSGSPSSDDHTTCMGYVSGNVDGTCQSANMSDVNQGLCE